MKFFKHLCLLLLQLSPIFANTKETCRPRNEVTAELENRYHIKFNKPSVSFNYEIGNIYIKEYNDNDTEMKLLSANVIFSGTIISKEKIQSNASSINFNTKLITIHQIKEMVNGEVRRNCKMTYSDNYDLGFDLPTEIEGAVIQITEQCLQTHLCQRFDSIVTLDFLQKQRDEESALEGINRTRINNQNIVTSSDSYNPQATINAMTDFAMSILITNFATDSNGTVQIPEIYQNFSTGKSFWLTTGDVVTSAGTFKNLTTLERISDVVFENKDLRFSVASTFRLANAEIKFGYYKVRYGMIKIDGKISGHIDGVTLAAKVSVDYNGRPCRIVLDYFNLEQLGDINIEMTGLGILNSQVSNIISYIIRNKTFERVKEAIRDKLYSLDCERYRPKNSQS